MYKNRSSVVMHQSVFVATWNMFGVLIFCVVAATAAPNNGMYSNYHNSNIIHQDYYQPLPRVMYEGIDWKEYKLILSLPDYHGRDIAVTVNNGVLTVYAAYRVDGILINKILYQRLMPVIVGENFRWIYNKGVFTIFIHLKPA